MRELFFDRFDFRFMNEINSFAGFSTMAISNHYSIAGIFVYLGASFSTAVSPGNVGTTEESPGNTGQSAT
jgi:hypothetical protein